VIQRDVKEDGRKETGEEVENDGRRYLSATGQDREFELEKAVEGEAKHGVDDACRRDRQESEDQVIDHDHGRDSISDIWRTTGVIFPPRLMA
jgi:hypothetical protein